MIVMGVIAVLQVCCIPGLIAARLFKLKLDILQGIVTIFMLSLTANYLAAFLLAALGLYLRPVALALLALELAALVWLYRRELLAPLGELSSSLLERSGGYLRSFLPAAQPDSRLAFASVLKAALGLALAVMAVTSIAWVGRVFLDNLGSVFNSWDAVLSWNRWAVAWSQNSFPTGTWQYPQLLPANWSMIYVIVGSAVQLFAKAIMPLFSLFILLMIFDLGLDRRRSRPAAMIGFFLAVVLTRLMIKKFLGDYIAEGYADIPVAFAGFLPVYTLLKARGLERADERMQSVRLGFILAGGAAVTKAAGLFILVLYPLLAWLLVLKDFAIEPTERRRSIGSIAKSLWIPLAAALLIALPWYAYKQVQIWQGLDQSNVEVVTNAIYQGAGLWQRVVNAAQSMDKYAFLLAFLIPALLVLEDAYRWIVALIVLPFTLSWALSFSYDTRNLALALPFLGLTAGAALGRCAELGIDALALLSVRSVRLRAYAIAGLGLLALGGIALVLPDQKLEAQQAAMQKQIFNPELNAKLYDFIARNGPDVRIATNYPVAALPGLEHNQVNFWYADFDTYQALVENGQVNYLLAPERMDARIEQDIESKLSSGAYKLVFEDAHYVPYRLIRIKK